VAQPEDAAARHVPTRRTAKLDRAWGEVEGKIGGQNEDHRRYDGDRCCDAANVTGKKSLLVVAAMAIILGNITACASIAAYQASHPPYRFPVSGGGGGGNGG
jgi:hypothetical protein